MIKFRKGGINHAGNVDKIGVSDCSPREKRDSPADKSLDPYCWLTVAGTMVAPSGSRSGPVQMQQSAGGGTGPQVIVLPTIEDIHLPPRYQRRPIDQKEIEYINVSFDGCSNLFVTAISFIYASACDI